MTEVQSVEEGAGVREKTKPIKRETRNLTDAEYDEIFKAVLARYPPISSQETLTESKSKDDFETIIENDEDFAGQYVDKFLSDSQEPVEKEKEVEKNLPTLRTMSKRNNSFSSEDTNKLESHENESSKEDRDNTLGSKGSDSRRSHVSHSPLPSPKTAKSSRSHKTTKSKDQTNESLLSRKASPAVQNKKIFQKKKPVDQKEFASPMRTPKVDKKLSSAKRNTSTKKQRMKNREIEEKGTWVQCERTSCMKWRYLSEVHDPSQLPEHWTCNMNPNDELNSCQAPEEDWDESEHIFTKFTEGSVVLARLAGFPYWPAIVEIDPDYDTFFVCASHTKANIVTKYHVVFFDDKVSRAWISNKHIKSFEENVGSVVVKGQNKRALERAKAKAQEALELPISERIKQFSFAKRFRGKWAEDPAIDVKLPEKKREEEHTAKKRKRSHTVIDHYTFSEEEDEMDYVEEIIRSAEHVLDDFLSNHSSQVSDEESPPTKKRKLDKKIKKALKDKKKKTDDAKVKQEPVQNDSPNNEHPSDESKHNQETTVSNEEKSSSETDQVETNEALSDVARENSSVPQSTNKPAENPEVKSDDAPYPEEISKEKSKETPAKKSKKKKKEDTQSKITPAKGLNQKRTPAKTPKKVTPKKSTEPKPVVKKPDFDGQKTSGKADVIKAKETKELHDKENVSKPSEETGPEVKKQKRKPAFKAPLASTGETKQKPVFAAKKKTLGLTKAKEKETLKPVENMQDVYSMEMSEAPAHVDKEILAESPDSPSAVTVLVNKLRKRLKQNTKKNATNKSSQEDNLHDDATKKTSQEEKSQVENNDGTEIKVDPTYPSEDRQVQKEFKSKMEKKIAEDQCTEKGKATQNSNQIKANCANQSEGESDKSKESDSEDSDAFEIDEEETEKEEIVKESVVSNNDKEIAQLDNNDKDDSDFDFDD